MFKIVKCSASFPKLISIYTYKMDTNKMDTNKMEQPTTPVADKCIYDEVCIYDKVCSKAKLCGDCGMDQYERELYEKAVENFNLDRKQEFRSSY